MKKISSSEQKQLSLSLNFLLMSELKQICKKLKLPTTGKKGEIVLRILTFVKDGKVITSTKLPEASIAKKGTKYVLSERSKILKGAYINNDETRIFMKKLVGSHFHFTAFGQQWLTTPHDSSQGIPNSQRTARRKRLGYRKCPHRGLLRFLQPMSSGLTFSPKA